MNTTDSRQDHRRHLRPEHPLDQLERGIVVSCQASPGDPTDSENMILAFAHAAALGGAAGIRLNSAEHIRAVRAATRLPIIGIQKRRDRTGTLLITESVADIEPLVTAGADIVALGAERRARPSSLPELIAEAHRLGAYAMADLRSFEDAEPVVKLGVDILSTTLSVYDLPPYKPNIEMIAQLVKAYGLPVIAEGNFWDPEDVVRAFEAGAFAVVIGSAITRPWLITERYVQSARRFFGLQRTTTGNDDAEEAPSQGVIVE